MSAADGRKGIPGRDPCWLSGAIARSVREPPAGRMSNSSGTDRSRHHPAPELVTGKDTVQICSGGQSQQVPEPK